MVPVYFTHKRFVLLSGKAGRALAELVELTPARVDLMLRLIEGPVLQRDMCIEMGVVPSVVTKMLNALERLGLVKRSIVPHDRRLRMITLLEAGNARLEALYDHGVPHSGLATVQTSAESTVLLDWKDVLGAANVRGDAPADDDMRPLLRRMVTGVWNTNYIDEWYGGPPSSPRW